MWKYVNLSTSIFLMGFTGLFAKLIRLAPEEIMLGRGIIASIAIGLFMLLTKKSFCVRKESRWPMVISGVLLVVHWVLFFYALQLSTIAIGMISLYTFPVMTAILEPLFFKDKIQLKELISAGVVFVGICIIAPSFSLSDTYFVGMLLGVLSAILYAIRNIMCRQILDTHGAPNVMFYHCVVVSLALSPLLLFRPFIVSAEAINLLLVFGIVFTAFAHTMWVANFKYFKATTTGIMACLAPVIGALAAMPMLEEPLNLNLLIGGTLILFTSVYEVSKPRV
jgi:drug/metabolite transporter (DMT)-like permease